MGIATRRRALMAFAVVPIVLTLTSCGDDAKSGSFDGVNPADFSARVDHPLFSLVSFRSQEFEGTERGA